MTSEAVCRYAPGDVYEAGGAAWAAWELPARAAEGDREALGRLVAAPSERRGEVSLGLAAALALAADRCGIEPPEAWRRALTGSIAVWLGVEEAARRVATVLDSAGVAWAPLKGYDVATRFYDEREARPVADLDLLVEEGSFPAARRALEAAGWIGLAGGERYEAFLREEAYAWQAGGGAPGVLELHYRLWGLVPEGLVEAILGAAVRDSSLGSTGRRLVGEHAYLVAAVHAWTKERPRGLLDWLDLERLAGAAPGGGAGRLGKAVAATAAEWSLELPVTLSATVAGRLWPGSGVHRQIAAELEPRLAAPERRLLRRLVGVGPQVVAYRDVVLARLLSGRPSRMGWRSVWRRLWPHPGVVARQTPSEWGWPRRRLRALVGTLQGGGGA